MLNKLSHIEGERAEKKVYYALERIFKKLDEDVLVVHGLKFMALTNQDEIEDFEKDFLIINVTKRYAMALEVKSCLSANSLKGAKKQMNSTKDLINEWIGATFTEESGWKFFGVICFDDKSTKYSPRFCTLCQPFVIIGLDDGFEDKIESLFEGREFPRSKKAMNEFLEAVHHVLFFASFDPVITSSARLSQHVSKSLDKSGSAENIEVYRCWTPDQQPLLKGKVQKVMFIAAPSTGKTELMASEACFLAITNDEDVSFFIPGTFGKNQKTLLTLKMENRFKDIEKINVCSVRKRTKGIDYSELLDMVKSDLCKNSHIFIDELHVETDADLQTLKEVANVCRDKTLWMAIISMSTEMSARVKSELENQFFIPNGLVHPLRNSSSIVKFAYFHQGEIVIKGLS